MVNDTLNLPLGSLNKWESSVRHTRLRKKQSHRRSPEQQATGPPAVTPSYIPPMEPLHVDYNVFVVGMDKKVDPYLTTVTINGAALQMEVDTGSSLTLISRDISSKLWERGNSPHLESTPVRPRTYSGEELIVVGRACGKG